jgi:hypothetical protein
MNDNRISQILDSIFLDFEENIFINDGVWPRRVNLVFAFSDYIESMTDAEIAYYLHDHHPDTITRFRFIARRGVELWLKENMKTLVI